MSVRYVAMAPRRVSRPRADFDDDEFAMGASITVHEEEVYPEETGLIDPTGNQIYRITEKLQMGFIKS